MVQASTIPAPVLRYQVVQTSSIGTRAVIAAFETEEMAEDYVDRETARLGVDLEIRVDPAAADANIRTLLRSLHVTAVLAGRDV